MPVMYIRWHERFAEGEIAMETVAKLFTNGRSQAVRIPKACELAGVEEVVVRKEGDALILLPVRKSWQSYADEAPCRG